MKLLKKTAITSAALFAIILLVAAVIFISLLLIKHPYNTKEKAFISDEIKISRNSKGFPSIEVTNKEDLFFALGYIHAKDQLNIMEYQRGIATGSAQKFAPEDADYLNKLAALIGFKKKAYSILSEMDRNEIVPLLSYCEGVNFIRKSFSGVEKLEQDWEPADILSLLIMREWSNSYLNNIELMININESITPEVQKKFRNQKYIRYYNSDQIKHIETIRAIKDLLEKHMGTFNRGHSVYIAENLHISPSGDTTIFSHLDSISTYPSWYPVKIKIGSKEMFALTCTGMPFLFSFKTENSFFYHFNINADTQDFFIIETALYENNLLYRSSGTLKQFETITNPSFPFNPEASPVLRITDKGPVLNDVFSTSINNNSILALNFILPDIKYIKLLVNTPFEDNYNKLSSYIQQIKASPKSFLFASGNQKSKMHAGVFTPYPTSSSVFKNGNVYTSSSKIPVNSKSPLKNIDKIGSDLIFNNEIPLHLSLKVISNENKIDRFNELLVPKKIYNDKKITEILNDTYSVTAKKFMPLFLTMLESNMTTSAKLTRIYFNDWDFKSGVNEISSSIFYSIMNNMIEESYQNVFKEDISNNMEYAFLLYNDLFTEISLNNTSFFNFANNGKFRGKDAVFETAFLNSMRSLNRSMGPFMDEWKWGNLTKEHYVINNPHLSHLSYFYPNNEKPIPGSPDAITSLFTNKELKPYIIESVKGYMNNSTMLLTSNYSYSTNIASEFYYGRSDSISMMNIHKTGKAYKTVINKNE